MAPLQLIIKGGRKGHTWKTSQAFSDLCISCCHCARVRACESVSVCVCLCVAETVLSCMELY